MMLIIAAGMLLGFVQDDRIDGLIKKLGAEEFADREAATKELRKIGKPATPALKKALEHRDPEVRTRAKRILKDIQGTPTPSPRKESTPRQPRMNTFGSSVTIQSVNGNTTYKITPRDGGKPITFYKSVDGRVQLKYTDDEGNEQKAESLTLDAFLKDHAALAGKYGITKDGINYGGARASFNAGQWQGFKFGQRFNFKPEDFKFPGGFNFRRLQPSVPKTGSFGGAQLEPVSDALRAHFEIPKGQGFVVKSLTPGEAAHSAGMRKNDVLLEVSGKPIKTLSDAKAILAPESTITILRKGTRQTLTASKKDEK